MVKFYDPDLPLIENYQYFRKPSATVQAKAKKKGHTLKDEYAETRSVNSFFFRLSK